MQFMKLVIRFGRRGKCEDKDALDEHAAESRVNSLERKYGVPYDAYPCGDHWHVGHSRRYFTLEEKRSETSATQTGAEVPQVAGRERA